MSLGGKWWGPARDSGTWVDIITDSAYMILLRGAEVFCRFALRTSSASSQNTAKGRWAAFAATLSIALGTFYSEAGRSKPPRLETRAKESITRASQLAVGTLWRSESNGREFRDCSQMLCGALLSSGMCDRTRKVVNYAGGGRSQGKPWSRLKAILTCKSFVEHGYRGERLIEPPSRWFPSKFLLG